MKKMLLMTSLVAASATLFTGCATLFGGGGTQQINIQSKKDTTVNVYKVSGEETKEQSLIQSNLKVPASVNVDRDSKDILIKPANSDCKEVKAKGSMNNWVWGDVIALSLVSTTTDAVSGAMWKYDENVNLDCK